MDNPQGLLRRGLPELPRYMKSLPLDARGYPVPFFVRYFNGEPDLRIADAEKWRVCVQKQVCWICGKKLGKWHVFVLGPLSTVNTTTGEPPCHYECAMFAVQACPFLSLPKSRRNDSNMPDGAHEPPGEFRPENPGITALWCTTLPYVVFRDSLGPGLLIRMPEFERLEWYSQRRPASHVEITQGLAAGIKTLREAAAAGGPDAVSSFERHMAATSAYHWQLRAVLWEQR